MNQQEQDQFNIRRFRKDWLIRRVITLFGWLVLATFLLLIWHIFSNAFPLFKTPTLKLEHTLTLQENTSIVGIAELSSGAHYVGVNQCDLVLYPMQHKLQNAARDVSQKPSEPRLALSEIKRFPFSCQHKLLFSEQADLAYVGVIRPDKLFELYRLSAVNNEYKLTLQSSIVLHNQSIENEIGNGTWRFTMSGDFIMLSHYNEQALQTYWFDKKQPTSPQFNYFNNVDLYQHLPRSRQLLLVTESVMLIVDSDTKVIDRQLLNENIKQIFLSPSQRSLFTQNEQDVLHKWIMFNANGDFVFRQNTQDISELDLALNNMTFDGNSNAGIMFLQNGETAFLNRLTNESFSSQEMAFSAAGVRWFADRIYVFDENKIHILQVANLQGITTLKSLFSEVWYEGYEQPEFVWQTSSAADNYETKFSIIPLIIGSLKASFLALFVAIPLALGAAIYTAYFADPRVRQYLKPAIEMLEAVPSVVIGFIAAVWLVPIAEEFLLSVILFIVSLPVLLVIATLLQAKVATLMNDKFDRRWEILIIILAVILLGLFCLSLSDVWHFVLRGSAQAGAQQDSILNISKTTIVVAIALGVAISPSIYSLAEDALYEVPDSIKQASFALGATKLQTLRRVIIAIAMPSILSAVMLGFGRAFGETMIVLMVTGNTPISDWNILEGLRSMTANLAIELQESNVNSSHFNTLFLTAGILFIFTFIVNTAAEILRNRLRKVYTDA